MQFQKTDSNVTGCFSINIAVEDCCRMLQNYLCHCEIGRREFESITRKMPQFDVQHPMTLCCDHMESNRTEMPH